MSWAEVLVRELRWHHQNIKWELEMAKKRHTEEQYRDAKLLTPDELDQVIQTGRLPDEGTDPLAPAVAPSEVACSVCGTLGTSGQVCSVDGSQIP